MLSCAALQIVCFWESLPLHSCCGPCMQDAILPESLPYSSIATVMLKLVQRLTPGIHTRQQYTTKLNSASICSHREAGFQLCRRRTAMRLMTHCRVAPVGRQ